MAANWLSLGSFICGGCLDEKQFPSGSAVKTEAPYGGGLRADVGVFGFDGKLLGVVEVIDRHPPTPRALAEQGSLDFAYYRPLDFPSPPKRRSIDREIAKGRFRYADVGALPHVNRYPCEVVASDKTLPKSREAVRWSTLQSLITYRAGVRSSRLSEFT